MTTDHKSSPCHYVTGELKIVKLAWRLPKYCNVSSQRNNLIKLSHYDETKKRAHNSQKVRAKENSSLIHDGPSQRQALGTNQPIKASCHHNTTYTFVSLTTKQPECCNDGVLLFFFLPVNFGFCWDFLAQSLHFQHLTFMAQLHHRIFVFWTAEIHH